MKNNDKEFGDVLKILERKFSSAPEGYVKIAVGVALSKLYEREKKIRAILPLAARKAFLYTTANNDILNELRRLKPIERIDEEKVETLVELADHSFENKEITKLLTEELLDKLPAKRKKVMIMHYLEGYTAKQIAEKLEISIHTVKEHIYEAIKQLRKITRNEKD